MNAPLISFYFQVHQPYRLRDLRITEIGNGDINYFDADKNRAIFRKVAEKCYLPANRLLLDLLKQYPEFRVSFSLSGVFLDQCEEYGPDVLQSFQDLAATGQAEFLAETYYHSLSYLFSLEEFCEQVEDHVNKIERLFGKRPEIFRNTELVYCNEIAHVARLMGFRGILAEGADHVLQGRSPNEPFSPPVFQLPDGMESIIDRHRIHPKQENINVLLKNYRLSDDVAFRFSDKSWVGFPLHADTFTDWVTAAGGHNINLYMDYETFGEHQWEDTGIFDFLRALPAEWQGRGIQCATPSEVLDSWNRPESNVFDAHTYISWADIERDLSAWRGNHIQEASISGVYALEAAIKDSGDADLLKTWRRLLTSDHFYYMCTKYWADGDVHKYFSPYDSPYEAYRRFSHALHDLRTKVQPSQP
jgi:alpha-amylase